MMGDDGEQLLSTIFTAPHLSWLQHVPAVQILRQVWVQQFEITEGKRHFRSDDNIPPPRK